MSKCPQPVLELIAHLKSTGTGESKLAALEKLGSQTKSPEQFLAQADKVVPTGTMKKIREYVTAKGETPPPVPPPPAAPVATETDSAKAPEPKAKKTDTNADEDKPPVSPVADLNAPEAIEAIGSMVSEDKLMSILDTDSRVTVKAAAEKRLEHLETIHEGDKT